MGISEYINYVRLPENDNTMDISELIEQYSLNYSTIKKFTEQQKHQQINKLIEQH